MSEAPVVPVRLAINNGLLDVRPAVVHLDVRRQQTIVWSGVEGDLELRFLGKKKSPYEAGTIEAPNSRELRGPNFRPNLKAGEQYPYLFIVRRVGNVIAVGLGTVQVNPAADDNVVEVEIRVNGQNVTAHPDVVPINRGSRDRIRWRIAEGEFTINFKNGVSPFLNATFQGSSAQPAISDQCKGEADVTRYFYGISVVRSPGAAPVEVDPGADVEDDGGDEGI